MDGKRQSSPTHIDGEIKRRKVLDTLSEGGPLTQEDVKYFQKEAIYRKMQLYKQQLATVESDLKLWKDKCKLNSQKVALLDSWWQILVQVFADIIGVCDEDGEALRNNSDVLFVFDYKDESQIQDVLDLRKKILANTVHLLKKGEMSSTKVNILTKVQGETCKLGSLKQDNELLKQKCDTLNKRVLELTRAFERSSSCTLKRTDESHTAVKEEKPVPVSNGHAENGVKTENTDAKIEDADANNEKIEDLSVQISKLNTNVAILTKQLEEESVKSLQYKQVLSKYEVRLLNLTEDDLKNSLNYKTMLSKIESLTGQNLELQRRDVTLLEKISSLENSSKKYQQSFESKLVEEKKHLQQQLEKAEVDLTRVRANRDEFISKLEILKADKKSSEVYNELTSTIDRQANQIEKLQQQIRGQFSENANQDAESLNKQNIALKFELEEMESAFKATQAQLNKKFETSILNDNLVNKLKQEKNKADQKYFGAMRAKDSLGNELKTLKIQQARSNDLINQLKEFEKICQAKCKTLDGALENFKNVNVEKSKEYETLKARSGEILASFDILRKKYDQLVNDKKTSTDKFHGLQEQIKLSKRQCEELLSKNSSLEAIISKYRKRSNGGEEIQEVDATIEGLKSIAKCSICSMRFKDTALKTCGHVFCLHCVDERLAARLRKCPSCNCQFSFNDLLSVHL